MSVISTNVVCVLAFKPIKYSQELLTVWASQQDKFKSAHSKSGLWSRCLSFFFFFSLNNSDLNLLRNANKTKRSCQGAQLHTIVRQHPSTSLTPAVLLFFRCHVSICPASIAERLLSSTSRSLERITNSDNFRCDRAPHVEYISTDTDLNNYTHMHPFHTNTCAENTTTDEIYPALALFQACSKYGEHEERMGFSPTGTVSKQSAEETPLSSPL